MVKYFLSYARGAAEQAARIDGELKEAGLVCTLDGESGFTAAVKDADFLFVTLNAAEQIDDPEVRRAWELFEGEIRWGRKKGGEIVFLPSEEGDLSNLPLRLKKYGYYLTDEIADLAEYCTEKKEEEGQALDNGKKPFPESREIKYTPHEDSVPRLEFSPRAPEIPSFDGSVAQGGERPTTCKDNHVFDARSNARDLVNRMKEERARKAARRTKFIIAVAVIVFIALFIVTLVGIIKAQPKYTLLPMGRVCSEKARLFAALHCGGGFANALQSVASYVIL